MDEVTSSRLADRNTTSEMTDSGTDRVRDSADRSEDASSRKGARRDAEGMTRESLYLSTQARDALHEAIERVIAALGGDVPKHVAVSALILAAANQADQVTAELVAERAAYLTRLLESLHRNQ